MDTGGEVEGSISGRLLHDSLKGRGAVCSGASPRSHGKPLSAQTISERLSLPLAQVIAILEDLQRHLFFLVLNPVGEVCWAYPVTCETTPHRLRFRSGERIYAA